MNKLILFFDKEEARNKFVHWLIDEEDSFLEHMEFYSVSNIDYSEAFFEEDPSISFF